jgi:organic hydroperoxide reductase OsmC/OhrA
MSFSIAENPELIIAGAVAVCFVLIVSFKFIKKRNVNVKSDRGSASINGKNSGNITINQNKEK